MESIAAAHRLAALLDAAPSPFHAVAEAAALLDAAGFAAVDPGARWPGGGSRGYVARGGNLVAWSVPDAAAAAPATPFRIVGAHTDSPNLRVKPRPDTGRAGVQQLALDVYGGALVNSWLDRDLGLSGRVVLRSSAGGPPEERLVRVDRPLLRVPQLAIHLDRDVAASGLQLNPQQHLPAVWALGEPDTDAFARFLAKEVDADAADLVGWDVMTHDVAPAALLGRDDELLVSGRLDNLCSAFAAVLALVDAAASPGGDAVAVVSLFDHEEVGSESASGAAGPTLATTLERSVLARRGDRDDLHRALAGSVCLSADMAHATHPNYADRHEPAHWITLGGGPAVKSNVNQRYATDSVSAAAFLAACEQAGVPRQHYVHRGDLPCGSTIGPITAARLGVATVDAGAPMLSMHSAREVMAAADVDHYGRALTAFLAPA